jgi:beta-lactamase regulating signal transducer with metallopeptidase domain
MWILSNILIASAMALMVGLVGVIPFFRRRPALMHVLWLIVLAKFVAPAFISVPLLPAEMSAGASNAVLPAPALPVAPQAKLLHAAKPALTMATEKPAFPWRAMLLAVSISGSALILLHALGRLFQLRRLLRDATSNPRLSELMENCRQRMSLRRMPHAMVIHARCSPFLLAIPRRARVYISQPLLESLSDAELEAVLCHELAHHLRRDVLANLFAFLVSAAVWWNPLAWLARRQLRSAQELCCDALVIARHPISRRAYAEILLSTLDQISGSYSAPALLAAGWGNVASLKGRFRMIGDSNVVPRLSRVWLAVALMLGASLLCVPGRAQSKAAAASGDKAAEKTKTWKVQIIDGEGGKPLPGIHLQANGVTYRTDENGIAAISVAEGGRGAIASLGSDGWWASNMNFIGGSIEVRKPGEKEPPAPDPNKPVQIKAWRGTMVTGRLLDPDAKPVAHAALVIGTYINNQTWKARLGMDLSFNSWDHGDWPNWSYRFETDGEGRFEVTVPPDEARSWLRISTFDFGDNYAIDQDPNGPLKAVINYAPFEAQVNAVSDNGRYSSGDLQLTRGTILRGKVVDTDGKPLSGITLYTSGKHGPYYGRSAVSKADGSYQFLPMHPGPFTLSPYAQLHDEKGNAISRDVQAVFVQQEINLPQSDKPVEMIIRAVPHVTLEFDWVDRRAKKGPVAYYGTFDVHGQVKRQDGTMAMWRGETEMQTRDGKPIVFIKVPAALKNAQLLLPADSVVTASYSDDAQSHGPGTIELADVTKPRHRVIYGDEPKTEKP